MLEIIKEFFGTFFSLIILSWIVSKVFEGFFRVSVVTIGVFLLAKMVGI